MSTRFEARALARFRVAPPAPRQALLRRPRAPAHETFRRRLVSISIICARLEPKGERPYWSSHGFDDHRRMHQLRCVRARMPESGDLGRRGGTTRSTLRNAPSASAISTSRNASACARWSAFRSTRTSWRRRSSSTKSTCGSLRANRRSVVSFYTASMRSSAMRASLESQSASGLPGRHEYTDPLGGDVTAADTPDNKTSIAGPA